MDNHILEPTIDCLRQEYVLVQAWKKSASFIRYHNWFSDTLELDRTTVNLEHFIKETAEYLKSSEDWMSGLLRIVPAPKSTNWSVSNGVWEPKREISPDRLRPLAHVGLRDQVVATAILLCIADRIETEQGDPRHSVETAKDRKLVSSYGNRLFCHESNGVLHHRWGSTKLYRSYFQDYRRFISRPTVVAREVAQKDSRRVFIVESDLKQFYDRVRPQQLMNSINSIRHDSDDVAFFEFAKSVLDWRWHPDDAEQISLYANAIDVEQIEHVALPQGLVAAGFFANVVLLSFDAILRDKVGDEIEADIRLEDTCRYVDDLRIVVTAGRDTSDDEIKKTVVEWLNSKLNKNAPSQEVSSDKTSVTEFGGEERRIVRQSLRMERIQSAVSGGFDAIAGQQILDSIQGLIRSQQTLIHENNERGWRLVPHSDVRDETIARFAAGRFRTTYRSVRPLLDDDSTQEDSDDARMEAEYTAGLTKQRTKRDLDEEAMAFALDLVNRWVNDPSNVRLLRIGLDVWPDAQVLRSILNLILPLTEIAGSVDQRKRVAWYCLAELLRAGATETGLVPNDECLPEDVDIQQYRHVLCQEATRLSRLPTAAIPWYLRQQALLFLAVFQPSAVPNTLDLQPAENKHYYRLIGYLNGKWDNLESADFATIAVLSRRAFCDLDASISLIRDGLNARRLTEIAVRDPSFALEAREIDIRLEKNLPSNVREDLCISDPPIEIEYRTLAEIIMEDPVSNPLRNELTLLQLSVALMDELQKREVSRLKRITPSRVLLKLNSDDEIGEIDDLYISSDHEDNDRSIYDPPTYCAKNEHWRFQIGYLLRFVLTGRPDFTEVVVREANWKERWNAYRPARSNWYQRHYGLFNAQRAFGDDWLPISDWIEQFLLALLHWPGCRTPSGFSWVGSDIEYARSQIEGRIEFLKGKRGRASKTLLLPMNAKWPTPDRSKRSLRACVVQTVVPDKIDDNDLTFSNPELRRRHSGHLSAALTAVKQMLSVRGTHIKNGEKLDLLILPELAVHPSDVTLRLIPFARAQKTIILAGMTYETLVPGNRAVNSALWVIPEWSDEHGFQTLVRRQGKRFLAPTELKHDLTGFRPCQWLIGYPWSEKLNPLSITGSVCYDATDLDLLADLRKEADVFAIPALNRDVKTFDQLALAMHYHMFQLVVVANNGCYGGSNAYWPCHDTNRRQILHIHGQQQATIGFFEITDLEHFLNRMQDSPEVGSSSSSDEIHWKYPPAGIGK